jgi:hypothetical protein
MYAWLIPKSPHNLAINYRKYAARDIIREVSHLV